MNDYYFTSESVTEGHPDKVCDYIADTVLDAYFSQDKQAHVACEVLCKGNSVVLAGEIKTMAHIDVETVIRNAIRDIGYTDPTEAFNAEGVDIHNLLGKQSGQIDQGVSGGKEQGAGDQGLMFGFACTETPQLMPLPITLAHRLARGLAEDRKSGRIPWLRPDGKTQVTILYQDGKPKTVATVVVSTQHTKDVSQAEIRRYVENTLAPERLDSWWNKDTSFHVNPTGEFSVGGPSADCGVTGRKIIVDTYGGYARHGGGAFSGKDPSKVDRSAAYFARYVARRIVDHGLASKAELQVSYAIGVAEPMAILVDTFGTGSADEARKLAMEFDFRPRAIIDKLRLKEMNYAFTTNYGHFGRQGLPWEDGSP